MIAAPTEGFEKAGLVLSIRGLEIGASPDGAAEHAPAEKKEEGLIPDAFEDALFDGIAAWLRDTL